MVLIGDLRLLSCGREKGRDFTLGSDSDESWFLSGRKEKVFIK